jgi:hypothetical protein
MRVIPLLAYLVLTAIAVAAADRKPTLLELAKEEFAPRKLTAAEVELFTATEKGDEASCLTYNENEDDPAIAWTWNDRVIHAECLTWLCTDSEASKRVTYHGININGMRIDGKVDLSFAEIPFPLQTWRCAFTAELCLRYAHLRALVFQTTNVKDVTADGVKIDGSIYLRYDFKADGVVDFKAARIGGDIDCSGAHFLRSENPALSFNSAKIQGNVYFVEGFESDGEVNLVNSEMNGFTMRDLSGKKTTINLRSAKAAILHDDELSWPVEGHLFLDGLTYDRIFGEPPAAAANPIQWLHRQPNDKFLPQPYEQLAAVLKNMGFEREARDVMLEKNRDHAEFTKTFSQEWWWYNVFGWLIGYGYAPSRAFFISVGMILLGWGVFRLGFTKKLISPTDDKAYKKEDGKLVLAANGDRTTSDDYPKFNALIFSLESFTPLLKLDQSSNWTPNANSGAGVNLGRLRLTTGGLLRMYLWFHIITGWVLTSLWVGALTGLVKT